MDRYELAWAAGFFDGEGWTNAIAAEGRRTRQPYARVNQADPTGVPEVLIRFQRAVGGLGRIGGPDVREGRQNLYRWVVSSRADVELLHHFLLPWLGQVKLLEFSAALGRAAARSRSSTAVDEWRAWAAGLYDGEGSLYLLDHRTHDGYQIPEMRITQSANGAIPEVLVRFVGIVGVGHINGPYEQAGATLDVYRWTTAARSDIEVAAATLWPWLTTVKRAQAQSVLNVVRSQAQLPRGRPDWGSYKTHCVHGHEYATARLRPYVARANGTQRRDSKQCLACAREQARARRAQTISESATRYLLK